MVFVHVFFIAMGQVQLVFGGEPCQCDTQNLLWFIWAASLQWRGVQFFVLWCWYSPVSLCKNNRPVWESPLGSNPCRAGGVDHLAGVGCTPLPAVTLVCLIPWEMQSAQTIHAQQTVVWFYATCVEHTDTEYVPWDAERMYFFSLLKAVYVGMKRLCMVF